MDNTGGKLNARKKAVALKYDESEPAPTVIAKGAGLVADRIVEAGRKNEIAVHEDSLLVEDLTRLDVGLHIPPELYRAVAQVLLFINELDKKKTGGKND